MLLRVTRLVTVREQQRLTISAAPEPITQRCFLC